MLFPPQTTLVEIYGTKTDGQLVALLTARGLLPTGGHLERAA